MATAVVRQKQKFAFRSQEPSPTATPKDIVRSDFRRKSPEVLLSMTDKAEHAAAMSDRELCNHIRRILGPIRFILRENLPYIIEARKRFAQQGRRVPLPGKPTFAEWIRQTLGFSDRYVRQMLQDARDGEAPRAIVRAPRIETPAAAMAVASAGFRLAHAVLHKDGERAVSLARQLTSTARNGVLLKDDNAKLSDERITPGDHETLFVQFQEQIGALADKALMPLKRDQREQALRSLFEAIACNYFERALVDVVGLSPSREPHNIVYPGGKGHLAKTIVSFLPKHGDTYVEPFAGRANVFWAAATHLNFKRWWLNDLRTVPFFRALQSMGATVHVPPRTRREYQRQWEAFKQGDEMATLLEPYLTFGGGGYGHGGFGGKRTASQSSYQRILRECHRIMKVISPRITSIDWSQMGLEQLTPDDVVVLDPPYKNADVRAYKANDIDHDKLLSVLKKAKFRWILCGYRHRDYVLKLGEPFFTEDVQLRSANCRTHRELRVECLWKNF